MLAALVEQAKAHKGDILPGYTHLQRAQPITFGHHLMAYAMMLLRDIDRMQDAVRRMNVSPIGCCALAGTTYDTDRFFEAKRLGFDDVARNSLDGVSDRDFCVELLDAYAIEMMHLSRLSEELVLWSSWEFQFVQLSDSYTTGSSIMPQKKNPDMAELVRGKTGRVYGDLIAMLTTDVELLEIFFAHTISPVAIAVTTTIVYAIVAATLSPWMALALIVSHLIIGIIVPRFFATGVRIWPRHPWRGRRTRQRDARRHARSRRDHPIRSG